MMQRPHVAYEYSSQRRGLWMIWHFPTRREASVLTSSLLNYHLLSTMLPLPN
jgi:hypothetical protein